MTLADSNYLFLLLLLIPYLLWYVLKHHESHPVMMVSSSSSFRNAPKSFRQRLIHLPFILRLVCVAMVIVALARPQTSTERTDTDIEGIDIMLCMDVSTSMLAMDLKPNRVDAARQVAISFVSGRPNDNIGLTIFAGEAFTQCPMTVDHAILLNMLNGMNTNLIDSGRLDDGTAIGMGLANAITRLKDSKAKSKVVILLTDGSNNSGQMSPNLAADIAKSYGIRVYTVAVGTNGTAPYPITVAGHQETIMVPVEIDTKTLKEISDKTDGKSYRAADTKSLQRVYEEIDQLERTKMKVTVYSKPVDKFMLFILIAVIALAAELLLRHTILRRLP